MGGVTVLAEPIVIDVDGIPATLTELSTVLPDGRVGYYQRSRTDCLKAATATCTQVPYDELPEIPNLRALLEWANEAGWRMDIHHPPDTPDGSPQWIGCSPRIGAEGLRHTVVGAYRDVYFDVASGWIFPGGLRAEPTRELEHAITLERTAP